MALSYFANHDDALEDYIIRAWIVWHIHLVLFTYCLFKMSAFNPHNIPVDSFSSRSAQNPLPTAFAGALGGTYNGYPQNEYHFGAAGQSYYPSYPSTPPSHPSTQAYPSTPPSYPSPPPSYPSQSRHKLPSTHRVQHTYDPSYSPSRFVQPSAHNQSYGFPTAPQSTSYNIPSPSPLARRNSVVDSPSRPRAPVSDYSSLSGALDGSVGPARSIQKHAQTSPYKSSRTRRQSIVEPEPEPARTRRASKTRRGSRHIGPCLPDGPEDHIRLPQKSHEEPVTDLGFQRIDHHRMQPIMFKHKRSSAPGIRLADINGECCPGLEGGSDRMVEMSGMYREAKIRILWPGYPPFEKRVRTQDLTRGTLLVSVAAAVVSYMKGYRKDTPKRGFEAWTIGRDRICPDDLLITGLEHRGGANFQVEIWVPKRKLGI
ncbi:hypothetical protein DFH06DRAFT_1465181 [Mycena polygramma]|nr:hypothetical protein DFH06DRAFT_1465181 [Mycena polygramma]